jgi:hypothetical protein
MADKTAVQILAIFHDPDAILAAAGRARHAGWKDLDMITPYPLHGAEEALGLKRSWVPFVTLGAGLTGGILGFIFQAWAHTTAWKLNIGGKSPLAWPAAIPITFESGILIGGIATFVAMWIACGLPRKQPRIYDERLTDDQFGLVVPVRQGMVEAEISKFLKEAGADEVRRVEA